MESFFKEAVSSLKTSGTIKPSSKHLIRDCLKNIDFNKAKNIVEFGMGDGCITQEIIAQMNEDTHLYAFETNPKFFDHCKSQFSSNKNVHLFKDSAFDFDKVIQKESGIEKVDYIVSSLPISLFSQKDVKALFAKISKSLNPNGVFVQYQYSLYKYRQLKKSFDSVSLDLTLRNLPPAFVFHCSNPKK